MARRLQSLRRTTAGRSPTTYSPRPRRRPRSALAARRLSWRRPTWPWRSRWILTTRDGRRPRKEYLARCSSIASWRPPSLYAAVSGPKTGAPDEAAKQIDLAQKLGPDQVVIAKQRGQDRPTCGATTLWPSRNTSTLWSLTPISEKAHRDLALVYAETGKLDLSLRELRQAKG